MIKKIRKNSERGQAIILVAFAIVGLVAIVGLMIDGGILLIDYARLKRGIDAASIAAASQFRKGYNRDDLVKAGEEFLKFNQSDAVVTISICRDPDTNAVDDATLCFDPPRKMVRITASRHVDFGFMRIVGINGTDITATSVGEAASIDLVLAIDTSSSMSYDTTGTDANDPADDADPVNFPGDNPQVCNDFLPGILGDGKRCEPLGQIIDVAVNFVQDQLLFYPYDRVAVVASTSQTPNGNRNPVLVPNGLTISFMDNQDASGNPNTEIQNAIRSLKVFEPVNCDDPGASTTSLGGCLRFIPNYIGVDCTYHPAAPNDQSTCGSSNIGGMLYMAGKQFDYARQEAFWVAIALIGGPATATDTVPGKPTGFCPEATWRDLLGIDSPTGRNCRDYDTPSTADGFNPLAAFNVETDGTRHSPILAPPANPVYPAAYDADDYARDAADYITSPTSGQGATMYSICLGTLCRVANPTRKDPWSGDHLGEYMAEQSGGPNANHGLYRYSSTAAGLSEIFASIANNIFTRISQ